MYVCVTSHVTDKVKLEELNKHKAFLFGLFIDRQDNILHVVAKRHFFVGFYDSYTVSQSVKES